MNSAPDRSEAALQFTLRKSARKTVTARKIFAPPADSPRTLHRDSRLRTSVADAPGWHLPAGLEAMVQEHSSATRPCQARKIAPSFKTHPSSPAIPTESRLIQSYAADSFTLAQMSYYVGSFRASWTDRSKTAKAK
jgi:hypothetical protein